MRYVWRHLPLNDVHPMAQQAAEATEAAAEQGAFWELHDLLLRPPGRAAAARPDRATRGSSGSTSSGSARTCASTAGGRGSPRTSTAPTSRGVSGTPTFFVNGRRHYGAYDIDTLTEAVRVARARAALKPKAAT